jgi:hypothetical protein
MPAINTSMHTVASSYLDTGVTMLPVYDVSILIPHEVEPGDLFATIGGYVNSEDPVSVTVTFVRNDPNGLFRVNLSGGWNTLGTLLTDIFQYAGFFDDKSAKSSEARAASMMVMQTSVENESHVLISRAGRLEMITKIEYDNMTRAMK